MILTHVCKFIPMKHIMDLTEGNAVPILASDRKMKGGSHSRALGHAGAGLERLSASVPAEAYSEIIIAGAEG